MTRASVSGFLVAFLFAAVGLADEAVWVGPATSVWNTATNWSTGVVPGFNSAARIDDNPNQNTRVEVKVPTTVGMLSIDPADTLAIVNVSFGVSRPLILDATVSLEGNGASFSAPLVVNSDGELKLAGASGIGPTATTVGLYNSGKIHGGGLLSLGTSTTTTTSWNESTISADNPTVPMSIQTPGSANFENDGSLVARDGGKLQIVRGTNGSSTDFGVLGGRIEAYPKSTVSIGSTQLNGSGYVENSVLAIIDDNDPTTATPVFQFYFAELKNVTLQGKFAMGGASIIGSLTNQGELSPSATIFDSSGPKYYNELQGDVLLKGAGTISLGLDTIAMFGSASSSAPYRLINVDNMIHGSGELAVSWYGFTNRSLVQADAGQNKELYFYNGLSTAQLVNSGVMKAINGGRLRLGYSSGNTSQMKNFEGGTAGQIIAEQNSSVLLNTIQIQGGVLRTVGDDAATRGKFIVEPGVVLQDVTLDGTFRLQTLAGVLSTIQPLNKNYNSGSLTARFNVPSNTSAEFAGGGEIISEAGTFLTLGQSSTFINDDNVIHGVGTIVTNGFMTTSIVNRGTFRAEGGTFAFYNQQPVTNSGLLDAATGATLTLPSFGTVTNYEGGVGGTIHAATGGVVNVDNVDGGTLATDGTGLIKISGYIKDLHNTGTIQMAAFAPPQGTIVNDGVINNGMNLTTPFVRFDGSGTWQGAGGSFTSGTVQNGPHHTILGVGDIGSSNTMGVFVNQGTLQTSDTATNAFRIYAASFQNSGLVHSTAGKVMAVSSLFARASNTGTIQADGNMTVTSFAGLYNENGGVIDVHATVTLNQTRLRNRLGGTIMGNGRIAGEPTPSGPLIINEGVVAPGPAVDTLTTSGDFQQLATGQLKIDVSGGASLANDLLQINGAASLAGSLLVTHAGSEALVAGNSFTFLAATDGISGVFDEVSLPALDPSLFWYVDYETNSVRALVADVIPGDFNRNGSVGAEDYVWWRHNGGSEQQYNDWVANYGRTIDLGGATSAVQVPEPAGGLLLVACGVLIVATQRHRIYFRKTYSFVRIRNLMA